MATTVHRGGQRKTESVVLTCWEKPRMLKMFVKLTQSCSRKVKAAVQLLPILNYCIIHSVLNFKCDAQPCVGARLKVF